MGKKSVDEVIDDIKVRIDKITEDEFFEYFTTVQSEVARERDMAIKIFAISGGLIGCASEIRCIRDNPFETRLKLAGVTFRKDLLRMSCGSSDVGEFLRRASNTLRVRVGYVGSQYSGPISQFEGCVVMVCSAGSERDGLLRFAEIELLVCESAKWNMDYHYGHEEVKR